MLCSSALLLVVAALALGDQRTDDCPPETTTTTTEERSEFLSQFNAGYGYPETFATPTDFEAFVTKELGGRLKGDVYLDWAGSALYTNSQVDAALSDLKSNLYGNPHSLSSSATRSTDAVESARDEILRFVGANEDDYEVIFTRSCTDSLRLVADTFPWSAEGEFRYLLKNHNSVLGIREVARARGATARAVTRAEVDDWLDAVEESQTETTNEPINLLAFPGEENFAGEVFPLSWAKRIVDARRKTSPLSQWRVLIDGAKFLATHPLNLTSTPADFVTLSFYKLFGFPTGVGALVALKSTANELTKCFFGGGTVSVAGAGREEADDLHVLKSRVCERFEDGTVSFLGIAELRHGFDALRLVGGPAHIERHTKALASYLDDRLRSLKHANGRPVVRVYGPPEEEPHQGRGPVVNFNVLDPSEEKNKLVSHIDVMALAAANGVHVRAGAECNPGAAYDYLGVPPDAVQKLATDDSIQGCGMGPAFITCNVSTTTKTVSEVDFHSDDGASPGFCGGDQVEEVVVPLGSVRASLGYLSTFRDVETLADFIVTHYQSGESPPPFLASIH